MNNETITITNGKNIALAKFIVYVVGLIIVVTVGWREW